MLESPPRRILIVDDDEDMAEVLADRLSRQGFLALHSTTGKRAIHLAQEYHPHLVLLDLRLPDVDGLSVCQMLSDDPATCDIPVIIVSGVEQSDIVRRARGCGCQFYVRKPYDPNALLVLIQRAIDEAEGW